MSFIHKTRPYDNTQQWKVDSQTILLNIHEPKHSTLSLTYKLRQEPEGVFVFVFVFVCFFFGKMPTYLSFTWKLHVHMFFFGGTFVLEIR